VDLSRLSLTKIQTILLIAPSILLVTTFITFGLLGELLGSVNGYIGGFLFYWIVWCGILPISLIGFKKIKDIFKDKEHRFGKPRVIGLVFLAGPFVASFFSMFLQKIGEASFSIIFVSALFAIVNGTMEELLWRGTFVTAFPKSWLWSYLYPSIWFGYWHLSPQVIFPSQMPGGAFGFSTMSIFMGLTFGWVAKKTSSLRWTTFAHILTDFMGLAGFAFIGGGY
jgi:membrane protease YdiL (CAAX protease family)